MKYIKLVIAVDDAYQEPLISEMLELEFDAFEQQEGKLITYVPKERFSDVNRERIEQILAAFPGDGHIQTEEVVADQNWNEEWERTIRAQEIGRFFVKPTWDFTPVPDDRILLEIDPKMAFGTGYHETTRLMLELLPEAVRGGERVMDAGTGTGILAIAAVKLGAAGAFAFDTDDWSIRNATENVLLNEVKRNITVKKGSIETIPADTSYDVIAANINRNTLVKLLPGLTERLAGGGKLLLSGLLISDREAILELPAIKEFIMLRSAREGDWIALMLRKPE